MSACRSPSAVILLGLSILNCLVVGVVAVEPAHLLDFDSHVLPLLHSHCIECHGPSESEAGLRLDQLSPDTTRDFGAAEKWQAVLKVLEAGEMPPPEAEHKLSQEDRQALQDWVARAVGAAVQTQKARGPQAVMRRFNRLEYQNTMFDLLGLEMDYARDLPPDSPSSDGFRNDAQALQMTAEQLSVYLDTARRALERVIVSGSAPPVFQHRFTESNVAGWLGNVQRSNRLGRQQQFLATMVKEYPEEGEFQIRVELSAELKPDVGYPILQLSVGYRPDTKILFRELATVEITEGDRQTLEFRGRIENFPLPVRGQGKYPGLVLRMLNIYDDGTKPPKGVEQQEEKKKFWVYPDEPHLPTITIHAVEFTGPSLESWPPPLHRGILFESPLREVDDSAYVRQVLQRFLFRAYRRPVESFEIEGMLEFFQAVRSEFPTFEEAIRETLAMALIRPEFLYLCSPASTDHASPGDWGLASRLSYFLWGTMPDDRLRELAAANMLHWPEVLASQVERLLKDDRSSYFIEQFVEQWLRLETVSQVAVNRDRFPRFDERLKEDMVGETQHFFRELVNQDLNALHLLSSDFTTLNESLARHYGISGVRGSRFRPVSIREQPYRGGLLGQASVLLSNSTGADSHAVRRAVWIRDRLLNDPPSPPPADVPSLDEADEAFLRMSIRQQLEVHREAEACAKCHRSLDPWGIALENLDAVGRWRDESVDARAHFPDGRSVVGVDGLKEYLLTERKDDFARSLVVRLLTYALGRRLELADQSTVDKLTNTFVMHDYRLRSLIKNIVLTPAFQAR